VECGLKRKQDESEIENPKSEIDNLMTILIFDEILN